VTSGGNRPDHQGAGRGRRRGSGSLTEPHRRELQVHCYRMLGSFQDAEDALQDHAAGRLASPRGFEGTRLDPDMALPHRHQPVHQCASLSKRRPAKEWDVAEIEPPAPTRLGEIVWLEPYPTLSSRARSTRRSAGSTLRTDRGHLPGLRDRTSGPARPSSAPCSSCAKSSDTQPAKWPTCWTRRSNPSTVPSTGPRQPASPAAADGPGRTASCSRLTREQALVAKFVRAYESGDVEALVALLTTDVCVSMPPIPLEYQARDVVARFYASIFGRGPRYHLVPTRANGNWRSAPTCAPPPTASATAPACSSSPSPRPDQRHDPLRQQRASHRSACRAPSPADNMTYLDQPWFKPQDHQHDRNGDRRGSTAKH